MAIGIGIFGQFKNSIGSVTFFKSANGQAARQRVTGVNPKTPGQVNARNRFTSSANAWSSLTPEQRATWNAYAVSNFQAKKPKNNKIYTGYQAFCGTRMTQVSANAELVTATTIVGGSAVTNEQGSPVLITNEAPVTKVVGDVGVDDDGHYYPLSLNGAVVREDGAWEIGLRALTGGKTLTDFAGFINSNGQGYGFQLQVSNALNTSSGFVRNPLVHSLGYTKSLTWDSLVLNDGDSIQVKCTDPVDVSKFKSFPVKDNLVLATLSIVGVQGQQIILGQVRTTISAAL